MINLCFFLIHKYKPFFFGNNFAHNLSFQVLWNNFNRSNFFFFLSLFSVYESSEKIILVMEYASGGELYDYLNERKRVSELEARGIFRQIVSAVHFLHKNRIVHRDLKLENILIDSNGDIKVSLRKLFLFSILWISIGFIHYVVKI